MIKKILKYFLRTLLVLFVLLNIITIFHAYKFTHFYETGDPSVKPDSLKSGWVKTKEMFFGFNFAKKKNEVVTDTAYHTIYLTTKDGLKLEGWYIPTDSAKGTVAMFHGHGGNKSGVLNEAAAFRKMGFNTLLIDFRAHGNSEGNTCTIGMDEAEDVKLAYEYIAAKGEKNILLWGISLGAATITHAISEYELKPSKVILEMPFGSIYDAVKGRMHVMHLPEQPLSLLLTFWGGTEHGFWAFGFKPTQFAKNIKCPVLMQWGKNDQRVSKGEIDNIYANIPGQKKLVVYDSSGHESLCKKEGAKWNNEVSEFLKQ